MPRDPRLSRLGEVHRRPPVAVPAERELDLDLEHPRHARVGIRPRYAEPQPSDGNVGGHDPEDELLAGVADPRWKYPAVSFSAFSRAACAGAHRPRGRDPAQGVRGQLPGQPRVELRPVSQAASAPSRQSPSRSKPIPPDQATASTCGTGLPRLRSCPHRVVACPVGGADEEGTASHTTRVTVAARPSSSTAGWPRATATQPADEALKAVTSLDGLTPRRDRMHEYLRERTAFFDRLLVHAYRPRDHPGRGGRQPSFRRPRLPVRPAGRPAGSGRPPHHPGHQARTPAPG